MFNFFGGDTTNREYKTFDKIIIGIIVLIIIYHLSVLKISNVDQIMFYYIAMLEMVGILYEYYN